MQISVGPCCLMRPWFWHAERQWGWRITITYSYDKYAWNVHYQVRLQYQYFHVQAHLRCLVRRCLPTLVLCKNKKSQIEAVEMIKRRQLVPHDVYDEKRIVSNSYTLQNGYCGPVF